MVDWSPPSCRLSLQTSISGACAYVCVCVCAYGFDQLELVRSETVVLQQRLLRMDEGLKPRWGLCVATNQAKTDPEHK